MNIIERVESAIKEYTAGNFDASEETCRKILAENPTQVDGLLLTGMIRFKKSDYNSAIRYLKEALQIQPENADACFVLGNAYVSQGSNFLDEARDCYQKTLRLVPDHAASHNNLGNIYHEEGKIDEAIDCFQKALQIDPDRDDTLYNLGNALQTKGLLDEAIKCYEKSLSLNPDSSEVFNNLGMAFMEKGGLYQAIVCYQNAVRLAPDFADAHFNLGYAFMKQGQLQDAVEHFQISLRINPDASRALLYLGNCLADQGKVPEAESCYRQAMQKNPDDWLLHEVLLTAMNYDARCEPHDILSEHVKFAKRFGQSIQPAAAYYADACASDHRIRIGYVSPDLRCHPVSFFFEPVLANHNKEVVETFCYSDVPPEFADGFTERLRGYADHWRNIDGMSDEQAADLIRNDRIDILIDLAGHTANNRMLLFVRKPAPVQVSWIGYPATTGLSAMDYKIVDEYTDPPGTSEQYYTEKLIRLPGSFLCYLPERACPEVSPLPALTSGCITFGSCNNFAKVSPEVIDLWAKILNAVPGSRLLMKAKSLFDKYTRHSLTEVFARADIAAGRIELLSWQPSTKEHLDTYNRIDIGLDTFPYNGTTTTCEAMWMGVPVITLAGKRHSSRVGGSILSNVGLPELIANTADEYVSIAVKLASDINRLEILRESLRDRMVHSPLTDAKRFTGSLENCFRAMWEKRCAPGTIH
jgi:protein O-GlcNAc transferase